MNIEKHSNDIRTFAENPNFITWFSKHLIVRRAPHESENNITMYLALVHKIGKPYLFNAIVIESELLLHKLLLSELPLSQTDRNILKNVGFCIGSFTISRNKSINAKYLNLKALIVNAYPNRLDVIIPIVHLILKPAKDSKVFSP